MDTDDYADDHATDTLPPRAPRACRAPARRTAWRVGLSAAAVALVAASTAACSGTGGDTTEHTAASSPAPGSDSASPAPSGDGGSTSPEPDTGSAAAAAGSDGGASGAGSTSAHGGGGGIGGMAAGRRCLAKDLGIHLGDQDIGAGNIHYRLSFTNKGSSTCTLQGFPGVSLLAGDGQTIGKPATREGGATGAVRLAPGKTAAAVLHTINEGLKEGGCWKAPSLLKAYPPGSKDAMTLRTSAPRVCGDTFTVTSLE